MRTYAATLAMSLLVLASPAMATIVIDFDSLEVANDLRDNPAPIPYVEDGFKIVAEPNKLNYAGQLEPFYYAGSAGLHEAALEAPITLAPEADGQVFALKSIQLSFLKDEIFHIAAPVEFTGSKPDGGTVTQSFTPTSFGFTTFTFLTFPADPEKNFENLTKVEWRSGSATAALDNHQFDNIVIDPGGVIPEPMTMLAVGMAVAGLGGYLRKRRVA